MKKHLKLLVFLFGLVVPSVALAGSSESTLASGGDVIYAQAIDATTGANITTIAPGGMTCTLMKNGAAPTSCGCTPAEVSDASAPGLWKCTLTDSELSVLGNYDFLFTDSGDNMKPQMWVVTVTNKGGDALLVAESGTTFTLSSTSPVNQDDQFSDGWEIVFFNSGREVAGSCITSSTNSGELITTEFDISGNPGVGPGIPYKVRRNPACHITAGKIGAKALTEQKFAGTGLFTTGSSSLSWHLGTNAPTENISGQQICHVPSLQCFRCSSYNTGTAVCTIDPGTPAITPVTPVNGEEFTIGGRLGELRAGTFPTNFSSLAITAAGKTTVGTNDDKTGYALTQAFPANFDLFSVDGGGKVTVGTNDDKTGYSLTQTFPANFSSLLISGAGKTTVGTNDDKTGYSLTQTFPANFSSLAITVGGAVTADITGAAVDLILDEVLSGHNTPGTVGAAILAGSTATDPWSIALPGVYSAGTAGKIIGDYVNASISSRLAAAAYNPPANFSTLSINGSGQVASTVAVGGITGDSFAADVVGHIGTAQSVAAKTIRLAAGEVYKDNELIDDHAVLITSATTGQWEYECICGNVESTDTVTLCEPWKTQPTGTVKYSILPSQNCNRAKWPISR